MQDTEYVEIQIDCFSKPSPYLMMIEQNYDYNFDKPFKKHFNEEKCIVTYKVLKEDEKWWNFWLKDK